jgi:acyl carrier protein
MKSAYAVVRDVLARHLQRHESAIHVGQKLERDLDLTPLELVHIARELESIEEIVVSFEELAAVSTVGDLLRLVVRARARKAAARPPRRAPASGSFLQRRDDLVRREARRRRA